MKLRTLFLILLFVGAATVGFAATMINSFGFSGNLNDNIGGGTMYFYGQSGQYTTGFNSGGYLGSGAWWWNQPRNSPAGTAPSNPNQYPGAGLCLHTTVTNPGNYSIGMRFKYNDFSALVSQYTKIFSFKEHYANHDFGYRSDTPSTINPNGNYGFYVQGVGASAGLCVWYGYNIKDTTLNILPNQFYDMYITRDSSTGRVSVYAAATGSIPTLRITFLDPLGTWTMETDKAIGLFYDDLYHQYAQQHTNGGTVDQVTIWDGALTEEEINPQTLPIELSSFTVTQTSEYFVQLHWVTQSETDVAGYYVYRNTSTDLGTAVVVSPFIPATNTSSEVSYSYTDEEVTPGMWYYWLQNMDMNGSSNFHGPISINLSGGGDDPTPIIPLTTSLDNIYPNPFHPVTTISFGLAKNENVNIVIYNMKGQVVRSLISESKSSGTYRLQWDGNDTNGKALPSGVYYVKMTAGKYTTTQKAILMK